MLPFDDESLATIVVAGACLLAAVIIRRRPLFRLGLITIAALLIRVDPARQSSLHPWDEQIHAVVAKNLVDHPLTPTLYERPVVPADPRLWTENHVWLHKPPLSLWLMAASLWGFGVSAFALRLPSILLSTLGVVLVFFTGRKLFGDRVGLLAAGFQAVNGLLVALASGRRVCDHVDTALIACVQAGVAVVLATSARDARWLRPVLAGIAMGAGLLAKSAPALLIGVVAAAMWFDRRSIGESMKRLAIVVLIALAVAGPWMISAYVRYPAEAAAGTDSVIQHMTTVLDGAGGPWWVYIRDLPRLFGELVFLPILWFLVRALRPATPRAERALLVWFVTPYVVFSAMPTKLAGFIAIGAPALFIIQAAYWCRLREVAKASARMPRVALAGLLALLAILPARSLLEPQAAFERRDRWPASTRQLINLDTDLQLPVAVIFNMPRALEAMFYSRFTAYSRMPTTAEVDELRRRAIPIVMFVPAGTQPIEVPLDWRAQFLEEAVR